MKKFIFSVLILMSLGTATVNAGCYWNDQDLECCEIGVMSCGPDPNQDCDVNFPEN